MSTSDKLTYLNGTKQALKESINNIGGDITNETTFREYAQELDNIYSNLPKTTGESSNLSLTTLKGKMNIIPKGDTKQESTTGANLLPYPYGETTKTSNGVTITDNGDGTLTLNGTSTDYINFYLKKATDTWNLAIGTYYLSFGHSDIGINAIIGGDTDNISYTYGTSKFSFNVVNGGNVGNKCLLQIASNKTFNNVVLKPMIAISSSATWEQYTGGTASPNPSYPQEVKVVRGKNRLDDSNLVLFNSNKYISTTNYSTQGKIAVNPSTTYTLIYKASTISDIGMWEFDSSNNKTTITYTAKTNGNYHIRLFTTLSNTKTMSFYAGSSDTYTSVEEFLQAKELVILEGDYSSQIIPSYLPYNTIEVKARGKNNLLCRTDIPIGYTRTDNGITWQRTGENTFKLNGTSSGNFTLVVGSAAHLMENLKTGETYTLSGCPSGGSDSTYRLQIFNYNGTNSAYDTGSGATFVSNIVSTSNVAIRVFDGVTVNNLEFNMQIELGSTRTSFIPFEVTTKQLFLGNFKPSKIGNYKDYFYKTSGKNLYNDNAEIEAYYYNASGEKVPGATPSETYINQEYNLSNTSITISRTSITGGPNIRICEYNGSTFIKRTVTNVNGTITLDSNTTRVIFSINKSSNVYFTNLMINLGNTALPYEPYGSGEWYFKAKNGEYLMTGNENITTRVASGNIRLFELTGLDIKGSQSTSVDINKGFSNCFIYDLNLLNQNEIRILGNVISIHNDDYTEVSAFKTWLASLNAYLFYIRANEVDTKITDTNMITQLEDIYNLMSYNGTTNISSSGSLPMILSVSALKGES